MSDHKPPFERGAIVKLNSGGPTMTVIEMPSRYYDFEDKWEKKVTCLYYNGSAFVEREFPMAILINMAEEYVPPSIQPLY
jgi:uncharacterized protein YodC (DUF2158 family)